MADLLKQGSFVTDCKSLYTLIKTRRTRVFAYGFMFIFIAFTAFVAFSPSNNSSSPWFSFSSNPQFSSCYTYFFPNSTQPVNQTAPIRPNSSNNTFAEPKQRPPLNQTAINSTSPQVQGVTDQNRAKPSNTTQPVNRTTPNNPKPSNNTSEVRKQAPPIPSNQTVTKPPLQGVVEENRVKQSNSTSNASKDVKLKDNKFGVSSSLMHCDVFDGNWVKDDSYPLYAPGLCPHIDESFDCYRNGRPDGNFQKYRWKPNGCDIPRLNGKDMLALLRGKRLVFVGDSLGRNMWESLLCILENSVSDKSKVYEVSGRREFRTEHSYLFVFEEYNCTVEFFRSPFLVQEYEMPETDGSKKETLRLDLVERSSDKYKTADYIIFNTGHWWTHEKTSKGKDYYQEGSHVYGELKVNEAFRKALTTWARWVDANINLKKSLVLFRGYSSSHFSGGQWNSGGQCDHETEPIKNETYLENYPPMMEVLEKILKNMKTPVAYLNITRMTDYRKDAHPSVFRTQHLSEEERKSPLRFQDCSHWCLPGVPDSWNELLYAQLLIRHNKDQQEQQQQQERQP